MHDQPGIKCEHCGFAWNRFDICKTLPVHDCSLNWNMIQLETKVLQFVQERPGWCHAEICRGLGYQCEENKKKIQAILDKLCNLGEIAKEFDPPQYYSLNTEHCDS